LLPAWAVPAEIIGRLSYVSRRTNMDLLVDAVFIVIFLGAPGALAAIGIVLLSRRVLPAVVGGLVLLVVAAVLPLAFAYVYPLGIAGAVVGGSAATVWKGKPLGWRHRAVLAGALVFLLAAPLALIEAGRVQADETFDRCAADKAVAIVEQSRAAGKGYPADMHEISLADDSFAVGPCYVSNGVNWLYRVGVPGTYTLGYWVDWPLTRRVCLHEARTQGWSCGFEQWGPFRRGEVD